MMPHHSEQARELIAACARYGICTDAGTDIFHLEKKRVRHRSCLIVAEPRIPKPQPQKLVLPGFLLTVTWEHIPFENRMGLWVRAEAGSVQYLTPILPPKDEEWDGAWLLFDEKKTPRWTGTLELEPVT